MAQHSQDEWNTRYRGTQRLFSSVPNQLLVELTKGLASGSAVDLGAGEGRNSLWLASQGWDVTAVDLSDVALERLRSYAEEQNLFLTTIVSDIETYLGQGYQFDLVVMAYIHVMPEERKRIFEAASAAVAPGGHLFIVGHHLDSLGKGGPPQPERLYTEDIFLDSLPGLELLITESRQNSSSDLDLPLIDALAWAYRNK
jgi:2-polyprenyl-3-methyl-5-hydroxy-6-metoxy-1,4-benzoquinol methylase